LPQLASFTGLLVSRRFAEGLGLRQKTDDATTVTDTLAAMLSLGVGSQLGHAALGPRFARLQCEWRIRARFYEGELDRIPARLAPRSARLDPKLVSLAGLGTGLTVFMTSDLAHAAVQNLTDAASQGGWRGILLSLAFGTGVW